MLVTCDFFLCFQNRAANVSALCSGQSCRLRDTICKASRPEVAREPSFASAKEAFLVSKVAILGKPWNVCLELVMDLFQYIHAQTAELSQTTRHYIAHLILSLNINPVIHVYFMLASCTNSVNICYKKCVF